MKMKTVKILAFLLSVLFGGGCTTSQAPHMREDFRAILRSYNIQAYDECLAQITRALNSRITKGERATLLMTKGICEEEKGWEGAATATYTSVKTDFDITSFAEAAHKRLERKDGDQREHLELVLSETQWRRSLKSWKATELKDYF